MVRGQEEKKLYIPQIASHQLTVVVLLHLHPRLLLGNPSVTAVALTGSGNHLPSSLQALQR